MNETAYFLHFLVSRHTSQLAYYIMSAYLIVRKYEIELLLSAINVRECQCFHRTFHFLFTVHLKKIYPINEHARHICIVACAH